MSRPTNPLHAVNLDTMTGLRLLHVGCGEGEMCRAALVKGARQALGVRLDTPAPDDVTPARRIAETLAPLGDARFDVIILTWCEEPAALEPGCVQMLAGRLVPDGRLVIETLTIDDGEPVRVETRVGERLFQVPARRLFERWVLEGLAARRVAVTPGPVAGVQRSVYHAVARRQNVLLVDGAPLAGKTNLAADLARHGLPTFSTDLFLQRLTRTAGGGSPFAAHVAGTLDLQRINVLVNGLTDDVLVEDCVRLLSQALPREPDTILVEGFLLSNAKVRDGLRQTLEAQGRRCWGVGRA